MRGSTFVRLSVLFLAAACLPASGFAQNARQASSSSNGMVATAQPLATDAGVRILEMGGNAADAAVAAAFAIAIVEPTMNSIGGRNQILIRLPDGTTHGIDGTTQAPARYDQETAPRASFGYAVVGVPGAVAGLLRLHSEHGSLPLATVMAPAIDYAEHGFRLTPGEAGHLASASADAERFPATRAIYLKPDDTRYQPGDMLVQKDYARTLRAIAEGGHDAFYRGAIAEHIAADLAAHSSSVTLQDLHDYEAVDARIVRGSYRGYDLVGLDVPAAGAVVIQALNVMENFDPDAMDDEEWAAVIAQALDIGSREFRLVPGTDSGAVRRTSKEWAAGIAARIRVPADTRREAEVQLSGQLRAPFVPADHEGHTTHLTVADGDGMLVALTQTIGPNMGSKVVTPGLGFLYAATLGGYLGGLEPGERVRSFISPFMVLKDGVPVLALGAAGGNRIVSGVTQVISRVIDDGMSLARALAAPRVHMDDDVLEAETSPDIGWLDEQLADIRAMGLVVREVPGAGAFSRVHAVHYDAATGIWFGAADPDREGTARGPRRIRGTR